MTAYSTVSHWPDVCLHIGLFAVLFTLKSSSEICTKIDTKRSGLIVE